MANTKVKGQTMKDQADDIIAQMTEGTLQELKQVHAGGQKDSKWRRVIDAFLVAVDEDGNKVPIWKIPAPDDGEYKINAITSGLNNALKGYREGGDEKPVSVTSSTAKKVVMLVNTELVSEEDLAALETAA